MNRLTLIHVVSVMRYRDDLFHGIGFTHLLVGGWGRGLENNYIEQW